MFETVRECITDLDEANAETSVAFRQERYSAILTAEAELAEAEKTIRGLCVTCFDKDTCIIHRKGFRALECPALKA